METLTVTDVPSTFVGESGKWNGQAQISQQNDSPTTPTKQATPHTVDALLRNRAQETPDELLVAYPSSGIDYVRYSAIQLDHFAFQAAQYYATSMPPRVSSSQAPAVVGLLGPSNLDYLITVFALTKLGHTVLFLSTRLSNAAYISLLDTTGAKHLLIDESFRETAETISESVTGLQVDKIIERSIYDQPALNSETDTNLTSQLDAKKETEYIAWIIHSSGSTGLPKPIYQTHGAALKNYENNMNMKGFVTLPLYHAHGISSLFRSITSHKEIYLYNANLPLTHDYLLKTLQQGDFEIFYGVPYALKILAETSEGLQSLAKLKVVMFGGSACPDILGNQLVDNNVNLVSHYGTTETGQLMTSFRPIGDKDWDYVRVPENIMPYLKFELRSQGIYELVGLEGLPSKVASNRPDGSYATKDLFTPHPTTPNAWKYYARLDDTIVLNNGEKTNPTSFEQAVRANSNVAEAVLFGSGKPRVGMMLIPSAATDGMTEEAILDLVLPVIETANQFVPAYARLALDMVKILAVGTPYPRTDKGTVIRARFYRDFAQEIEDVYEASEIPSGGLVLSETELQDFIHTELSSLLVLKDPSVLSIDTDFFSLGVDSLHAIQLRSAIAKQIDTNGQRLGSNIVFDFPTLRSLARKLYCLRTGEESEVVSVEEQMAALINKYGSFEKHVPQEAGFEGRYMVVTGATGSLGAHVIAQLAVLDDVKRVYCLVRASSKSNARTRVIRSLIARSVYHSLPLAAREKIVALPSNFGDASLGLDADTYDKLASEITSLIHCAWSVNFNLGLGSFEADCIAGAHNLIQLCLRAKRPQPASFDFCSSVSAVAATPGGYVPEALPKELSYAQGMGYARSKLVTENICIKAAEQTGMNARVLRVGQVIGDTKHGIWNDTEAIPMMLQAATTVGAIPTLDENPTWLPVDVVANSIVDVAYSNPKAGVLNIVNHQSFHWTRDLLPALHSTGLEFLELGQKEWVERLRTSDPDPVANPPIKLLEFFAGKYDNNNPRKGLQYETSLARSVSPSLAAATVIDEPLVAKFIKHWMATSWTQSTSNSAPRSATRFALITGPRTLTVAQKISEKFNLPVVEGESLARLSDQDRQVWFEKKRSEFEADAVIVTCSPLDRTTRAALRHTHQAGDQEFKISFLVLQSSQTSGGGEEVVEPPADEETDIFPLEWTASDEDDSSQLDVFIWDFVGTS